MKEMKNTTKIHMAHVILLAAILIGAFVFHGEIDKVLNAEEYQKKAHWEEMEKYWYNWHAEVCKEYPENPNCKHRPKYPIEALQEASCYFDRAVLEDPHYDEWPNEERGANCYFPGYRKKLGKHIWNRLSFYNYVDFNPYRGTFLYGYLFGKAVDSSINRCKEILEGNKKWIPNVCLPYAQEFYPNHPIWKTSPVNP